MCVKLFQSSIYKESGFEVANRIHLYYADNEELAQVIEQYKIQLKKKFWQ